MKRKCFLPLFLIAALGTRMVFPAKGEDNVQVQTNALALPKLVDEVLAASPELKFYEAELAAARAGRKSAGLLSNPELNTTLGVKSLRERGANASTEGLAWSASVLQPFEWPGRLSLRKAIANRDVQLAELGLEKFRASLAARANSLAYSLLIAQEKAAAAREVADRFQALREVLVQRDPAGLSPLLETRIIEATELTMQRKATEAALATKTALLELNQLRGQPADKPATIQRENLHFGKPAKLEELLAQARTNNFELRARMVELAQQGFRVDLAKNERFPAISVGPTISEERAGDRERIVGVGVTVPLPLWNRNSGNIEAAQARKAQAEASLALAHRELERQVAAAALAYQTALEEMAKWRPDTIEHFREAAELADRHYRLGAVPVSTYVELQKQYFEAVEGLLQTRKEALEAGQQLEVLAGLPQRVVKSAPAEEKQ